MDKDFLWIVGIENAFIPDMAVDQLEWTGHKARWRQDLALAKEVGARAIRYGVTWPELNPAPDRYEWAWCDQIIAELERLELEPIWDLIHFGTPTFLKDGFFDKDYVSAVATFSRAFARRYRGSVTRITPLNEPYISTLFRAGRGIWPPYLKGPAGFVKLLFPIVEGLRASIRAIKEENPAAEIWLNDGADTFHPTTPDLTAEAARRTLERYAAFDLLLGLTEPGQESYEWLNRAGYPTVGLTGEPLPIDVIGLDYYPETEHDLYRDKHGELATRKASKPFGIYKTAKFYFERYGKPLFIAESSHGGSDAEREAWLDYNLNEIKNLRAQGLPLVGYTWWPLFDHIDWNTLLTRLEGHICPAGLYHLQPGVLDRQPTAAAKIFRSLAEKEL